MEVKSTKKSLGLKFGPKEQKSGPKLGFMPFSQVWLISFFCEIAYNDNLQQCITCTRGKTLKNFLWESSLGQTSQNEAQN